jgi:hypothetical protein
MMQLTLNDDPPQYEFIHWFIGPNSKIASIPPASAQIGDVQARSIQ